MSEKPIIFSPPMVKAILEGEKTVTRRIIKVPPCEIHEHGSTVSVTRPLKFKNEDARFCPYEPYHVGDILWVREKWKGIYHDAGLNLFIAQFFDGSKKEFSIDNDRFDRVCMLASKCGKKGWQPSIFMPREAARIFLEIKSISVGRLQEIGLNDVLAEGIRHHELENIPKRSDRPDLSDDEFKGVENWILSYARYEFEKLWDGINSKRGYPWRSNPWVWVIEFRRIDKK